MVTCHPDRGLARAIRRPNQRDLARREDQADIPVSLELERPGAIVTAWLIEPPQPLGTGDGGEDKIAAHAASAKAQALAIAPPNASPLEIQYLALDLEEGVTLPLAVANLANRRQQAMLRTAGKKREVCC